MYSNRAFPLSPLRYIDRTRVNLARRRLPGFFAVHLRLGASRRRRHLQRPSNVQRSQGNRIRENHQIREFLVFRQYGIFQRMYEFYTHNQ